MEIAVAVDWRWPDWEEGESTAAGQAEKHGLDWLINRCLNGYSSPWRHIPEYSASIDSAMSLKPAGWRIAGLWERNCALPNWIWKVELWHPEADQNVRGIARNADVAALALTAASLRALSQPTVPQP